MLDLEIVGEVREVQEGEGRSRRHQGSITGEGVMAELLIAFVIVTVASTWIAYRFGLHHGRQEYRDCWRQDMDEVMLLRDRMEAIAKLAQPVKWDADEGRE